jgi:hypothetical protein
MSKSSSGKIALVSHEYNAYLQISHLHTLNEENKPVTPALIKKRFEEKRAIGDFPEVLLEWYLHKSKEDHLSLSNITIASGTPALKKGSHTLKFSNENYCPYKREYWDFVYTLFKHITFEDLPTELPYKLFYVKKGTIIAHQNSTTSDVEGRDIAGDVIPTTNLKPIHYAHGEFVHFDQNKLAYIADESGFVSLHNDKISVYPPFYLTRDHNSLFFINFDREPFILLEKSDISSYFIRCKIGVGSLVKGLLLEKAPGEPILVGAGKPPTDSIDARVEFFTCIETKYSDVDDKGNVNYREVQKFPSVLQGELIARKILAVNGQKGCDLFGKTIPPVPPKDVTVKNGLHISKEEKEDEILFYSGADGLIEYKNGQLSIYSQLTIGNDVDFRTGNINTKVNVHINGSVRTGFSIKSEKSIFVTGTIEDNCKITSGADLIINGGASGQNNSLTCGGNMSIKFIEGGTVYVKGDLSVQSFILGAEVICNGNITIAGTGINLKEKGTIIDCDVYVGNTLICPAVGNNIGQKTYINFAYDKARNTKIANMQETLEKITKSIDDLRKQFSVDINATNIHLKLKSMPADQKEKVIAAIQEKNKLENQYKMIEGILIKEQEAKAEAMATSTIQISGKVFAPLLLECDSIKKKIDTDMPPSKFYWDAEEQKIERSRDFGSGKSAQK